MGEGEGERVKRPIVGLEVEVSEGGGKGERADVALANLQRQKGIRKANQFVCVPGIINK